jgi:hypothetical protein
MKKESRLNENDLNVLLKRLDYGRSMWTRHLVEREQSLVIDKIAKLINNDFSENKMPTPFLEKIAEALGFEEADTKNENSLMLFKEIEKRKIKKRKLE